MKKQASSGSMGAAINEITGAGADPEGIKGIGFSYENMEQVIADAEGRERHDLEARAKPLYELVIREKFSVERVTTRNYAVSIFPSSEECIGGRSSTYGAGFRIETVLDVKPWSRDVSVRKLLFPEYSAVCAGDDVSAAMPAYREERPRFCHHDESRTYYMPAPLGETQHAISLTIYHKGKETRTELSTLWGKFQKPVSGTGTGPAV